MKEEMKPIETMEHKNIYSKDGAEVEFRIKAECSDSEEMRRALGFLAQSSHRFYLEAAEKIKGGSVNDTR